MLGEVSEGVSGRGRVTCLGAVTGLLPEISRRDIDDGGCCIFEKTNELRKEESSREPST